jgi:hypothetical protein
LSSKPCTTEKNLKILNIQINMKEDPWRNISKRMLWSNILLILIPLLAIWFKGKKREGVRIMEGLKQTRVPSMYRWKCYNNPPVQLLYINKKYLKNKITKRKVENSASKVLLFVTNLYLTYFHSFCDIRCSSLQNSFVYRSIYNLVCEANIIGRK